MGFDNFQVQASSWWRSYGLQALHLDEVKMLEAVSGHCFNLVFLTFPSVWWDLIDLQKISCSIYLLFCGIYQLWLLSFCSYCECFAAGVYCLDSCACENCLNKPEYEDTVLDTRQQIEARNPLAFAPKVVKQTTNSPANVVVISLSWLIDLVL